MMALGAVVLAWLYRNIGQASCLDTRELGDFSLLLEVFTFI